MRIDELRCRALCIPFRLSFSHASATREATQALWVEARSAAHTGYGEGCPREYVTGESAASAAAFVSQHAGGWREVIDGLPALREWGERHRALVDRHPAAWCAFELAVLDLIGRRESVPVEAVLGLPAPSGRFAYTAVIGDGPLEAFRAQLERYRQVGFRSFKIKLAGEHSRDQAKVEALRRAGMSGSEVRADANNLWRNAEEASAALRALSFRFAALEEPLAPGDYAGMARLGASLGVPIILDESLTRVAQLDALPGGPEAWIVNVRVSKMGGLLRALALVAAARQRGLRIVVGAHVGETSLLTRAALPVARAAADCLLAQEGAFGTHLLAHDAVAPTLTFGARGMLDADELGLAGRPGWGLSPAAAP